MSFLLIMSLTANPIVAEQICMTPELRQWHNFIHQFSNFYLDEMYIYVATITNIFMQIRSFS